MARAGKNPEGVHQLRVAVARIRVWLDLGRWRVLHDDLRWLRAKAAPVRDLDVQLAREAPAPLRGALVAEREAARSVLLAALDDARFESLVSALASMRPVHRRQARKCVARFVGRALARGRAAGPKDYARLHALRRSVRRVRFAIEWMGEPVDELIALQDALGAFGDAWVAVRRARRNGEGREIRRHRRRLEGELRDSARVAWRSWRRTERTLEALS